MNIEEAIENLKIYIKVTNEQIENGELFLDSIVNTEKIQIKSIETLLTAYEKEKEKNKSIVYNYEMVVDKLENSTPNYKIKAIIEELQEDIKYSANPLSIDNSKFGIKVLQSLLEKE